ncbi:MAG: radical SAM protein [Oscillospiraceae bacterium]|jgi:uncharacterized radical SAM superfamily Fe-S cluster-containing enzyme|nr:radical SAM protein [Oscillospiraceae bacterium]
MNLGKTESVCPVCLKRIPAERTARGGDVYLDKLCPEHGAFSALVWRGGLGKEFDKWRSYAPPADADLSSISIPGNKTCCALVEVTKRCDLRCPVCFAESGDSAAEPSVRELSETFRALADAGNTFVQLSGGEPTVRDDLPEIVAAARRAGCETVQLNSNGLRLGREPGFTKALADAGLSFVFMQFDGVTDGVYKALRGLPLLAEKRAAIEVCDRENIGVTLVPTLVPGVNDGELGEIIAFAVRHSPAVRGVHFQPVSYFGRYRDIVPCRVTRTPVAGTVYGGSSPRMRRSPCAHARTIAPAINRAPTHPPDNARITLPEVLRAIESQTSGKFKIRDFNPSSCDHPCCGFHGDFVVLPKGRIMKLTKKYDPDACCAADAHLKNRSFVARRWTRPDELNGLAAQSGDTDYRDMSAFLSRVKSHGFTISAMAFQDAWTLDLERLRRCSLHVADGARVTPFCARYLTKA